MRIIVDTMGSDKGCAEITKGVIEAVNEFGIDAIAVGNAAEIAPIVAEAGLESRIEIVDAPIFVTMEDDHNVVIRGEKSKSSMVAAMKLLSDGKGDAVVTAGNTGATITAATLYISRIRGIRRAALAPIMPLGGRGGVLLIDCGANVACTPEYLLQFAYMGSYYMRFAVKNGGEELPRVGLLNIGTESHKGTELQQEAYKLLTEAHEAGTLNFIGNIEGRDIPFGVADVVVADGFSGNVCLKTLEGMGKLFGQELKRIMYASLKTKIGGLMLKKDLNGLKKQLDYKEIGGSPLIGISAPVFKAHGSADAFTLKNAIKQSIRYVEGDIIRRITENIDKMKVSR
ncbi:MAG: phosphate acyltransferase PlsX [Ruminococcaceae bacterium]|nr:phosphate acyltransferase PlsX [Oscillospiraceae bacterium]MBQ4047769.1 phosphate acyltransferase PlsX [Clostridia bacterium]